MDAGLYIAAGLLLIITFGLCLAAQSWISPCWLCFAPGRHKQVFEGVNPTRVKFHSVTPGAYYIVEKLERNSRLDKTHTCSHERRPLPKLPVSGPALQTAVVSDAVSLCSTDQVHTAEVYDASPNCVTKENNSVLDLSCTGIETQRDSHYCKIDVENQTVSFNPATNNQQRKARKSNYSSFMSI